MKATIYIRKENEDWWEEFGSSAWVNEMIIQTLEAGDSEYVASIAKARKEPTTPLCKHGYAKGNCKHAGCNV